MVWTVGSYVVENWINPQYVHGGSDFALKHSTAFSQNHPSASRLRPLTFPSLQDVPAGFKQGERYADSAQYLIAPSVPKEVGNNSRSIVRMQINFISPFITIVSAFGILKLRSFIQIASKNMAIPAPVKKCQIISYQAWQVALVCFTISQVFHTLSKFFEAARTMHQAGFDTGKGRIIATFTVFDQLLGGRTYREISEDSVTKNALAKCNIAWSMKTRDELINNYTIANSINYEYDLMASPEKLFTNLNGITNTIMGIASGAAIGFFARNLVLQN